MPGRMLPPPACACASFRIVYIRRQGSRRLHGSASGLLIGNGKCSSLARVTDWQDCCAIEKASTDTVRHGCVQTGHHSVRNVATDSRWLSFGKKEMHRDQKMCGIGNRGRKATKAQPVVVEAKAKYQGLLNGVRPVRADRRKHGVKRDDFGRFRQKNPKILLTRNRPSSETPLAPVIAFPPRTLRRSFLSARRKKDKSTRSAGVRSNG